MPNAMQNSTLVNQINQIFTSNSLTANTPIENKPKESFNKIYKNELANGVKKTSDANKPVQKTATPPSNQDKSVKPQRTEDAQTETNGVELAEEDLNKEEYPVQTDTNTLLNLVDHIAALTTPSTENRVNEKTDVNKMVDTTALPLTSDISAENPATAQQLADTSALDLAGVHTDKITNGRNDIKAEKPELAALNSTTSAITAEAKTQQEITTEKQPPVDHNELSRPQSFSSQIASAMDATKKDDKTKLAPISAQTPEKNAISNKDNLQTISTLEHNQPSFRTNAPTVNLSDRQVQELDSSHSQKLGQTAYEPSSKAELFSKELASRFAENNAAPNNTVQTSITAITSPAPTLAPAPGVAINGIGAVQMQDYISPRVGSKGWDLAIGQKMIWMVAGEESSVQLSLNPPDLGPLQVVLSVNDNQIDASFISAHLDVREAIEAASPKLKEMMESAGISLSGFSVSAQAQSSENGFSQAQQQRDLSNASSLARQERVNAEALKVDHNRSTTVSGKGLVDTFV